LPSAVSRWKKSAAMMPRAWLARNCFQVRLARRGAGSIPAEFRICQTVDAAIRCPASSPWTLLWPQRGLSWARRSMSFLIAEDVGGCPVGRRRVL
jgi:hypothetical protein